MNSIGRLQRFVLSAPVCLDALRQVATGAVLLVLAGCAAGPDFRRPPAPAVNGYTAAPLPATVGTAGVRGGAAQRFVPGADIPAQWWRLFHSKMLDTLVERALNNSPDLAAAQAALDTAQEAALAQRGANWPGLTAGLAASRQKTSSALSPTPSSGDLSFRLYTPQVSVEYMPDVFGLNRRTLESLRAQVGQQRFALVAARLALSGNLVAAAVQEASLRAQVAATRRIIAAESDALHLLRAQLAQGYASRIDVAAQESQLAQAAATLPPLLKQLAQQRDLLAALVGGFPDQPAAAEIGLDDLELPHDLPVSLPSRLIEQRPDVRQAEENLHAASAQVGIASAERLPNLTLSADAGAMALATGQMFAAADRFRAVAGSVTAPIFQGGALRHREKAAEAAYAQGEAQYRGAVIAACQNVADVLHALEQDAAALQAAAAADAAAKTTLDLTRRQVDTGYAGALALANAEQSYQTAEINLVQAQASRYLDTAALFVALGGGWWNQAQSAGP